MYLQTQSQRYSQHQTLQVYTKTPDSSSLHRNIQIMSKAQAWSLTAGFVLECNSYKTRTLPSDIHRRRDHRRKSARLQATLQLLRGSLIPEDCPIKPRSQRAFQLCSSSIHVLSASSKAASPSSSSSRWLNVPLHSLSRQRRWRTQHAPRSPANWKNAL